MIRNNKILSALDKDGGKLYIPIRLILDLVLLLIWIPWSGSKISTVSRQLCPIAWQTSYCNTQASKEGLKQIFHIFFLLPFLACYALLFFFYMKRRTADQPYTGKKMSSVQTWTLRLLLLHFYICFLWCFYAKAIGVGAFVLFIVLLGLLSDVILLVKYFLLRRSQRRDEEESGPYSTRHAGLIQ